LIPDVKPIEINIVGLQAAETAFNGLHHVLALVATGVGVIGG
jgi:hypothetical protein